ncbi:AAA family ATPase [Streptomyces sp. NPDC091027]|uniref:AAA family ATPase n=1 Tax=Streptomyces sp. NPDC091027 TaxID=3365971 RepID=UPI00381C36CA
MVSGPPATGKTTLARELAQHLGCPAILRDEIKQGMVMNHPGHGPDGDDPLNIPLWRRSSRRSPSSSGPGRPSSPRPPSRTVSGAPGWNRS